MPSLTAYAATQMIEEAITKIGYTINRHFGSNPPHDTRLMVESTNKTWVAIIYCDPASTFITIEKPARANLSASAYFDMRFAVNTHIITIPNNHPQFLDEIMRNFPDLTTPCQKSKQP